MSVYYVHAPETGLLKIGFASDPRCRWQKMQVDSPTRLILLAVEDGSKATEAKRHRQFGKYRARGEWFRYEGELKDHVASLDAFPVEVERKPLPGPLGAWMKRNGHTLKSFAAELRTTHSTIWRTCTGVTLPNRDLLVRIIEATDWEVDAHDLLGIAPPTKARKAA